MFYYNKRIPSKLDVALTFVVFILLRVVVQKENSLPVKKITVALKREFV